MMPEWMVRKNPSVWHVLTKVDTEEVDEKKQDLLGWPSLFHTFHGACGLISSDLATDHEFRPVHDVPYNQICKGCWPYLVAIDKGEE
jgi:hypothetical protein